MRVIAAVGMHTAICACTYNDTHIYKSVGARFAASHATLGLAQDWLQPPWGHDCVGRVASRHRDQVSHSQ